MLRLAKILMVASIGLAIGGIGLALAQPGDLGDGDDETADTAATTEPDEQDTTEPDDDDEDPSAEDNGDTAEPEHDATSTTSSTTASPTSSTTATTGTTDGGSGLDSEGAAEADDTSNGLADTGGDSMLAAAALLALIALAIRPRHSERFTP